MGHVVSFTPRITASHSRSQAGTQAAAIIIFPGVRYERNPKWQASHNQPTSSLRQAMLCPRHQGIDAAV